MKSVENPKLVRNGVTGVFIFSPKNQAQGQSQN